MDQILQLLLDNWVSIVALITGAVLKDSWVFLANKISKKGKLIVARLKDGLEDTEELLDVLEKITEDGKINKAEIIEGVEAGKEYYTEIKGIAVSFKKKE